MRYYHHRPVRPGELFDYPCSISFREYEEEASFLICGKNYNLDKQKLAQSKRKPSKIVARPSEAPPLVETPSPKPERPVVEKAKLKIWGITVD